MWVLKICVFSVTAKLICVQLETLNSGRISEHKHTSWRGQRMLPVRTARPAVRDEL